MANSFIFKEITYKIGDTVDIDYKIKEGDKERVQSFKGIVIKVKGDSFANRMITVRKISKSGLGIERVIPLSSPFIGGIKLVKKSNNTKAKLYFIRGLSDQELRTKLYQTKKEKLQKRSKLVK